MAVRGLNKLIIDKGMFQTTRVRLSDDQLFEIEISSRDEISLVGNVYRGRVSRVVNGINAAFVDIGEAQNAYLQLGGKIKVRQGEDVIVQVIKDADGGKGAKLTQEVSLPGKYAVYLPLENVVKVSRSIEGQSERERLQAMGESITLGEFGLVIRTQGKDAELEDLKLDIQRLQAAWESIRQEGLLGMGPKLIYQGYSIAEQAAEAVLSGEVDQLIVNDSGIYNEALSHLKQAGREAMARVELFDKSSDIFDFFGIKKRIKSLSNRRIWLRSGGNIVFEKTEALTVIDVNTAKSIKGSSAEDTIFKTNMEAAEEIAMQIKLRDIGGIVLVDFIDMKSSQNKAALLGKMRACFASEHGKTKIYGFTELGIMEISRKNEKREISVHLLADCPCCRGNGKITSRIFLLDSLEKEVKRIKTHADVECAMFELNTQYYGLFLRNDFAEVREIAKAYGLRLLLASSSNVQQGGLELAGMGNRGSLVEKAKAYAAFIEIN